MFLHPRKVKLLIELIRLRIAPTNKLSRKTVINFLIEKSNPEDPYLFFESLIKEPIFKFFERLGVMSFQDFINTPLLKSIDLLILKGKGLYLHASQLEFTHPFSGKKLF